MGNVWHYSRRVAYDVAMTDEYRCIYVPEDKYRELISRNVFDALAMASYGYVWPWQTHRCGYCRRTYVIEGSYKGFNCTPEECEECEALRCRLVTIESRWDIV